MPDTPSDAPQQALRRRPFEPFQPPQRTAPPAAWVFPRDSASLGRLRGLVREHERLVGRSLRRMGVPARDVDDAAQEVFVVAARRLGEVAKERERAFLLGTASRVASTRKRTARRHPEDPADWLDDRSAAHPNPEELFRLRHAESQLWKLLGAMERDTRDVLLLAELEELPLRDVADELGIPLGTVNSRLRRARNEFRAALKRVMARDAFVRRAPARDG